MKLGRWMVWSEVATRQGVERRLVRRCFTRRGAEGLARFYEGFVYLAAKDSPDLLEAFLKRHRYSVEPVRD